MYLPNVQPHVEISPRKSRRSGDRTLMIAEILNHVHGLYFAQRRLGVMRTGVARKTLVLRAVPARVAPMSGGMAAVAVFAVIVLTITTVKLDCANPARVAAANAMFTVIVLPVTPV